VREIDDRVVAVEAEGGVVAPRANVVVGSAQAEVSSADPSIAAANAQETPGVRRAASDDWHTTTAEVDLRVGGAFSSRMEAKDGSMGFDFEGTYTEVVPQERIAYALGDGRVVVVDFTAEEGVRVREAFDAEGENPIELQRRGWQAILDSFARHVEGGR
jgi:hypothetical protein